MTAFNQPTAKTTFLIIVQHVDVAQITKSGIVCDQTGEADLSCSIQSAKQRLFWIDILTVSASIPEPVTIARGNREWLPAEKAGIGCDNKFVFGKTQMLIIHRTPPFGLLVMRHRAVLYAGECSGCFFMYCHDKYQRVLPWFS